MKAAATGKGPSARRKAGPAGVAPLPPRKKWRAITVATLLLVPAYWAILTGLVAAKKDSSIQVPNPGAAIALGLALIPFVFIVLAFMSEHPRAPGAILRAMGLSLLVAIPVSAVAADAVTGIVAGVGAGGVAALRADEGHTWKSRAIAVAIASVYAFLIVRMATGLGLLVAPILPLTAIGVADHLAERRQEREASRT